MSRNKDRLITQQENSQKENEQKPLQFLNSQITIIDLPSEGLFYPEDHPLYMKDTLDIYFPTVSDVDTLSNISLNKKGIAIPKVLQNMIVDKNIKLKSLISCDESALTMACRIHAIDSSYEVKLDCMYCEKKFPHTFFLPDIKSIKRPWEDFNEEIIKLTPNMTFEAILPLSEAKFEFRFLNGFDEEEMRQNLELKQKKGFRKSNKLITEAAGPSTLAKKFVVSINDNSEKSFINQFIRTMPARDLSWIVRAYNTVMPQLDTEFELECPFCGNNQEVMVPITRDFLWPSKLSNSCKKQL